MVPISAIMPVYNTPAAFLPTAVDSILAQSFEDFEFVILDDDCSSNEETLDCLRFIRDSRVKSIRNPVNQETPCQVPRSTFFVDNEGRILSYPIVGANTSAYEETVDELLEGLS